MITQEQRDLRNAIVAHAADNNPDLDPHTEALISVLGSVIEGIPIERAMGAPGNWGYGTPIGDALLALIQPRSEDQQPKCCPDCQGRGWLPSNDPTATGPCPTCQF